MRKITSSYGTWSSQGVTNFLSRGPGAVMRRAVTEAASVANDAPMAGTPSARPSRYVLPHISLGMCLRRSGLRVSSV